MSWSNRIDSAHHPDLYSGPILESSSCDPWLDHPEDFQKEELKGISPFTFQFFIFTFQF